MNTGDIESILAQAIFTVLKASAPVLAAALGTGLVIALFQALTQIQEMTLTFVPKIVVIFLVLLMSMSFMFLTVKSLSDQIFDLISIGGGF